MRSAVSAVLEFQLVSVCTLAAQNAPMPVCPRPALASFLRLTGSWDVHWETAVEGTWVALENATASIRQLPQACGVVEELQSHQRGEGVSLVAVVAAPSQDSLQLSYIDSWRGGIILFSGFRAADTIRFVWQHDWGDHVQLVNRDYVSLSDSGFSTLTRMSPNGGRTWTTVQRATYVRHRSK
jgi:hypothetical protein